MRILRNSPLINQPTGPVEINKNAPLADDLIFLYSGHENLDYVSGKVGIDTTSHSLLRDEIGLSYDHINKSNVRTFTHNYSVQNSYIVSLIYIKRSSFNDGRILSAANGTNERFQIHDDNANTKTGFVWWNDLPGFDARRLDTAVSLGNWERHCTFWYNVSAQEVVTSYCSHKTNTGAAPETSTATNAQLGLSYLDWDKISIGGKYNDSLAYFRGSIYLVALFRVRAYFVQKGPLQALADNPWQLFIASNPRAYSFPVGINWTLNIPADTVGFSEPSVKKSITKLLTTQAVDFNNPAPGTAKQSLLTYSPTTHVVGVQSSNIKFAIQKRLTTDTITIVNPPPGTNHATPGSLRLTDITGVSDSIRFHLQKKLATDLITATNPAPGANKQAPGNLPTQNVGINDSNIKKHLSKKIATDTVTTTEPSVIRRIPTNTSGTSGKFLKFMK